MRRHLALTLGPWVGDEDEETLRVIFEEHRDRFTAEDWATRYFELGIDDRPQLESVDAGVWFDDEGSTGCPGC